MDDALIARLAAEELPKARSLADAEKRTKRRLHQIVGAYRGRPDAARTLLALRAAWSGAADDYFRDACRAALAQHASTRERLPILDDFYARVFAVTGTPSTVVDIGCGLNPLAVPWMGLPRDARYVAYDVDRQLLDIVSGGLDLLGIPCRAASRDLIAAPPDDACDVALLLKTVPNLDQQHPDAAARVLSVIRARHIVISFPTRSLGGRGKGMARTYRQRFADLLDETSLARAGEFEFDGELVFVVSGEG